MDQTGAQFDAAFRVVFHEIQQRVGCEAARHNRRRTDAQFAHNAGLRPIRDYAGLLFGEADREAVLGQPGPEGIGHRAPPLTLKQRRANALFQKLEIAAERGLRDAKSVGGGLKRTGFNHHRQMGQLPGVKFHTVSL